MPEQPSTPVVHVLHENPEWIPPFASALDAEDVPWREWTLDGNGPGASFDLAEEPPAGIYWSRLSASSHTRGHEHAKDTARATLRWLEAHGRRVIGGSRVVELEVSKITQALALRAAGFEVPRTIAVFGREDLTRRARELPVPFITKHNQGGKGLGVQRFDSHEDFDAHATSRFFEDSVDGITLLQEYVTPADPSVTRAEFVGGEFLYAVRVDTSAGSFELCPAEACEVPPTGGLAPAACAVPGTQDAGQADQGSPEPFRRRDDITADDPFIAKLASFLREQGVEIAGVEFIETADGRRIPYDINTNTNYNPAVEADGAASGARAVARFLKAELARAASQGK